MHIYICHAAINKRLSNQQVYIQLIFKFIQHKNVNVANFVYYGKTRL